MNENIRIAYTFYHASTIVYNNFPNNGDFTIFRIWDGRCISQSLQNILYLFPCHPENNEKFACSHWQTATTSYVLLSETQIDINQCKDNNFLSWLTIQANKLTSWKGNGNVVLNVLYFGMTLNQSSAAHHSLPWSSFSQRIISIYSRSKRSMVRAVPYPKFHPIFTKPNNIRFSSKSIVEIEHAYFR